MNKTVDQFKEDLNLIQTSEYYKKPLAFSISRVQYSRLESDKVIYVEPLVVNWMENFGSAAMIQKTLKKHSINFDGINEKTVVLNKEMLVDMAESFNCYIEHAESQSHKNVQVISYLQDLIFTKDKDIGYHVSFIFEDKPVESVEVAYLKLNALSLKKVPLRSLNLDGIFGILPNLAWDYNGKVYELEWLRKFEIALKASGTYPVIAYNDKFPNYLRQIIPADNTRIIEAQKVRLGAQLAAGTTVMPGAAYINFNAGTEGSCMVEGRISSSAIVGEGSDIGGGASILGVLSGTDGDPVTVGKACLLGANSVTGFSLGDGCILDAGTIALPGVKYFINVNEWDKIKKVNPGFNKDNLFVRTVVDGEYGYLIKGKTLSEMNGIHIRQNSETGRMTVFRSIREVKLNKDLH